jgi:SAM-dependent MidA family methyltransferase
MVFIVLHKIIMKNVSPLLNIIKDEIHHQHGIISFARFMELALYHPDFGYYNSPHFSLGRAGDFTTAPEISPLFAQCFAREIAALFRQMPSQNILEIGAGSGRFASVLLQELEKLHASCTHYFIFEISSHLRQQQHTLLSNTCPELLPRVTWLDHLPDSFEGIIAANEVLDALPTHCFRIENSRIQERGVSWHHDQLVWKIHAPVTDTLHEQVLYLKENYQLPDQYESEINLQMPIFVKKITELLTKGVIFFMDYGYGQREFYHPERNRGSLTCFYQHQAHDNPFTHIGLQDITAHVDFTQVIASASDDCELLGYTSQAAFLLDCGLLELAAAMEAQLSIREQIQLHQVIKILTLPTEMGERVKVMAIGKQMDCQLQGFKMKDRRRDL